MMNRVALLAILSLVAPARGGALPAMDADAAPFTSKFDRFWDAARSAGLAVPSIGLASWTRFRGHGLGDTELLGLAVFNTKGKCSECHPLTPARGSAHPPLTDFDHHNLGLPRNPAAAPRDAARPWVQAAHGGSRLAAAGVGEWPDRGAGGQARSEDGQYRTPTLRNVHRRAASGRVKAYGHNGYFKSLAEAVSFYNSRAVLPACGPSGTPEIDCWPAPEEPSGIDRRLGDLRLDVREATALIAFLRTLDDGYSPSAR